MFFRPLGERTRPRPAVPDHRIGSRASLAIVQPWAGWAADGDERAIPTRFVAPMRPRADRCSRGRHGQLIAGIAVTKWPSGWPGACVTFDSGGGVCDY